MLLISGSRLPHSPGQGRPLRSYFGISLSISNELPYVRGLARLIGMRLDLRQDCAVPMDRRHKLKEQKMRAWILLVMVLVASVAVASVASAQQVYKCVDGENVSYQSAVCDAAQVVARQWNATPEPEPSAEQLRQYQLKREHGRIESAWLSRAAGTNRVRSVRSRRQSGKVRSRPSRCDTAKARREAKLKSVGLKRTFDLLRRLDDSVYEACK